MPDGFHQKLANVASTVVHCATAAISPAQCLSAAFYIAKPSPMTTS